MTTYQDAHTEAQASSQPPPSSILAATSKSPAPSKPVEPSWSKPKGQKRASEEMTGSKQKKRQKKSTSDVDQSASEDNSAETKKKRSNVKKLTSRASPPPSIEPDQEADEPGLESKGAEAGRSESEMSELIDEAPRPKGRPRTSDSAKPKARKSEGKKSSEQTTDPDADEIKRLQGWLIKCGIRKMWHRELASCETPKAKIRHLKEMLSDAGMTGRFSAEKASQIKEERELKADLEAVQEGAKQWGKEDEEAEVTPAGRPKRRLARGLEGLDFLNDDDGEESD